MSISTAKISKNSGQFFANKRNFTFQRKNFSHFTCIFQKNVVIYIVRQSAADFARHFSREEMLPRLKRLPEKTLYALVAQLDRVFGYEPKGRGFESLPAHHIEYS